ncbi:MAG: putative sugar O-methyltransferase [Halopseudomonas aestusnigri]
MTGIFKGPEAIGELEKCLDKIEKGSSSHWNEMHENFTFDGSSFSGLGGFGEFDPPAKGLRKFAHFVMQSGYRAMGRGLKDFETIDQHASGIAAQQNRNYNLDILRQALTLSWLLDIVPDAFSSSGFVAIIGDGFATLTSLILKNSGAPRVVMINLSKTLLVDLIYLNKSYPEISPSLVTSKAGLTEALSDPSLRVIAIQADKFQLLENIPIRLAVNIASMQEMSPSIVAGYFKTFRKISVRNKLTFYCCNREEKILPDGTEVKFSEYPWLEEDTVIVDELCPWHQTYYTFRPPFLHYYDGAHRHRLSILVPDE